MQRASRCDAKANQLIIGFLTRSGEVSVTQRTIKMVPNCIVKRDYQYDYQKLEKIMDWLSQKSIFQLQLPQVLVILSSSKWETFQIFNMKLNIIHTIRG